MNWTTYRRETGLIEHGCEHGVGHPNAASILRMNALTNQKSWGVHGCDGCCSREDFPGNVANCLKYSYEVYSEHNYIDTLYEFDRETMVLLNNFIIHDTDEILKDLADHVANFEGWQEDDWQAYEFMWWGLKAAAERFGEKNA